MEIFEIANLLEETLTKSSVTKDYCLGADTTYRVGGNTDIHLSINSNEDLLKFAALKSQLDLPILIIGLGSNMLISDSGFNGISLCLGRTFAEIKISDEEVCAGALSALPVVARKSVKAGLGGFEWAVAVPGSIGGAVRMNAGAHGSDMSKCIKEVDILDLETGSIEKLGVGDLNMAYRSSNISSDNISSEKRPNQQKLVLSAKLSLEPVDIATGDRQIKEIVKWRRKNQPGGQNAGSVFKNPKNISAGQLLDEAGAKNLKVGSASVSHKHANFIQVKPKGSAQDVFRLIQEMRELAFEYSGIELEQEIIMVNFQ